MLRPHPLVPGPAGKFTPLLCRVESARPHDVEAYHLAMDAAVRPGLAAIYGILCEGAEDVSCRPVGGLGLQ